MSPPVGADALTAAWIVVKSQPDAHTVRVTADAAAGASASAMAASTSEHAARSVRYCQV
jgi:hypothetical protein